MAWWSLSNLRTLLVAETDADSGVTEETYAQIRENLECLTMSLLDTGVTGSATSNPPDDTTGVLTNSGGGYDVDAHNGRTLLMTSGLAIGNLYTIDDTTATTLVCTGDNLYSDGVRSADTYKILYDIKVNADGHNHDGINSASVGLADRQVTGTKIALATVAEENMAASAVAQGTLKTTLASVSVTTPQSTTVLTAALPGGEYGFRLQVKGATAPPTFTGLATGNLTTSYASPSAQFLGNAIAEGTGYAQERYVTSSGEQHWIFIERDKTTKDVFRVWQSQEHPCFGVGGDPVKVPHPHFPQFDSEIHELVCITPSPEEVDAISEKCSRDKDFIEVLLEEYTIDEESRPKWPTEAVTVGLPDTVEIDGTTIRVTDWTRMPIGTPVTPIKKVIPEPDNVIHKSLKRRYEK